MIKYLILFCGFCKGSMKFKKISLLILILSFIPFILFSCNKKYNVTFIDGQTTVDILTFEKNEKLTSEYLPANPNKIGYNFLYWSIDGNLEINLPYTITSDLILYSVYEPITYFYLNEDISYLEVGHDYQIDICLNPSNYSQEFIYTTSDSNIATVSDSGLVSAISEGEVTITILSIYGTYYELDITIIEEQDVYNNVIDFLYSLDLNYTYTYWSFAGDNQVLVSEYGVYDSAYNSYYYSYVKAVDDKYYSCYYENPEIYFLAGSNVSEEEYINYYSFSFWINDIDFRYQMSYDSELNAIYLENKCDYDPNTDSFIYDHNYAGGFLVEKMLGDYGYVITKIEFVLDYNYEVVEINFIVDEADEYLSNGNTCLNGQPMVLNCFITDIDETNINWAYQYYINGNYPIYSRMGSWEEVIDDIEYIISENNQLDYLVYSEILESLPSIDYELDYEINYQPLSFYYFSRISVYMYNVSIEDAISYINELDYQELNDYYGLLMSTRPNELYILPTYYEDAYVFELTLYFERHNEFPYDEIEELLYPLYGDIVIPILEGALCYHYINYFGNYIACQFYNDANLEEIIAGWANVLITEYNYVYTLTAEGVQYQDPSRQIAIVFSTYDYYEKTIYIDFYSAGSEIQPWLTSVLEEYDMDFVPQWAASGYSYTYNYYNQNELEIDVINAQISYFDYVKILSDLSFIKVFDDPFFASPLSFLTFDGEYQITIMLPNFGFGPTYDRTYDGNVYRIFVYPAVLSIPNINNTDIYPSLYNIVHDEANYIPIVTGSDARYQLLTTNIYYLIGGALTDLVYLKDAIGYYVIGLTEDEANTFRNYFNSNYAYQEIGDGLSFYFNLTLDPGFGVRVIDFTDNTFLVCGARISKYYDNVTTSLNDIQTYLATYQNNRYASIINQIFNNFPSFESSNIINVQLIIKGKSDYGVWHIELDIEGLTEDEITTLMYLVFNTSDWSNASIQNNATWCVTKYIVIPDTFTWLKISFLYYEGYGLAMLFELR